MQKLYRDVCSTDTQVVYRSRIMLVGPYGAGKTSVKRSLLHEKFVHTHETTDGIETVDQTCVVNIDTAVNWRKGIFNSRPDCSNWIHIISSTEALHGDIF